MTQIIIVRRFVVICRQFVFCIPENCTTHPPNGRTQALPSVGSHITRHAMKNQSMHALPATKEGNPRDSHSAKINKQNMTVILFSAINGQIAIHFHISICFHYSLVRQEFQLSVILNKNSENIRLDFTCTKVYLVWLFKFFEPR